MALWKYFKREVKAPLPSPSGSLSKAISTGGIVAANKEVQRVMESINDGTQLKRGPYEHFDDEERAQIGKYAADHGVAAAVRHFQRLFPTRKVKESSVRTWRNKYLEDLQIRKEEGREMVVKKLPFKKRGRPLLLGDYLDRQLQAYVTEIRQMGLVLNTSVLLAAAKGLVLYHDSNWLKENGGHLELSTHWAKGRLRKLEFSKRRVTTKASLTYVDFEERKAQFVFDAQAIIELEEIPDDLVVNWDQTGIHYVPVSDWTMEKTGAKRVAIAGANDKRQITAVFAGAMNGTFLPPQLIYQGKTPKCLPPLDGIPPDWDVTFTENHWVNEMTVMRYLENILFPYFEAKRAELQLDADFPCLVIYDRFRGQCTPRITSMLKKRHIYIVIVPANCTDRLQPLDVSVNKSVKAFLRNQFQDWYATCMCQQMRIRSDEKTPLVPIDLKMSIVKPLGVQWMLNMYKYITSRPDIIKNGFCKCGIKTE